VRFELVGRCKLFQIVPLHNCRVCNRLARREHIYIPDLGCGRILRAEFTGNIMRLTALTLVLVAGVVCG